jgi:hypothetical protein
MMKAENVVEIFSSCGCRPKRLYEITVALFYIMFPSSVITHATETKMFSPSVLVGMEHTDAFLREAMVRNLLQ